LLAEVAGERPFEIKEIEGKGMGVIATRDIKAGELILKEKPFVVWADEEDADDLEAILQKLTDRKREEFYAHHIANPYKGDRPSLGIFKTNGLPLHNDGAGLFEEASRFNHSCRPNCSHHWDEGQEVSWSIANRDIGKGEEICITYGKLWQVKSKRREWWKTTFGFDCRCEACSYPEERATQSDIRRFAIHQMHKVVKSLKEEPLRLVLRIKVALKLFDKEGLLWGSSAFAHEAFKLCLLCGDRLNASRWLDKTLELETKEVGVWSTRYKELEVWKGDPTLHPFWKGLRCLEGGTLILIGPE